MSQAAADLALTPAVDDIAGAQSLRALPAVGALTATLSASVALGHLTTAPLGGLRLSMALAAALSALLLAVAGAWVARYGVRRALAGPVILGALLVPAAHALVGMVVLAEPRQSLLLAIVIVAAGPLVVSRPRLVAALGGILVSWTAGAVVIGSGADAGAGWLPYGVGLLAASAASAALHVHAARNLAQVRAVRSAAAADAVRDDLTGCLNPRGLAMFGTQILESARRQGDAVHCLFVAVDGLARVTEVFGDDAGEDLLIAVADALRSATRATDVVARWDTDVFVVLGPGRGSAVPQIERRIAAGLTILTVPVGPAPRVLAVGSLLPPWDAGTIDSLLHKADDQLAARRSMRRRAADAPAAGSAPAGAPPTDHPARP